MCIRDRYQADTFFNDLHKTLKADFIMANPPFNLSNWGQDKLKDDVRWKYGTPPAGNANYAWIQHMIHPVSYTHLDVYKRQRKHLSAILVQSQIMRQWKKQEKWLTGQTMRLSLIRLVCQALLTGGKNARH